MAGTVLLSNEEDTYEESYLKTTFRVTESSMGSYRCVIKRNCECAESTAPSCSSMVSGLDSGQCSDGYHCCRTECDTCYDTCHNTCHDTCTRQVCNRRLRGQSEFENSTKFPPSHRTLTSHSRSTSSRSTSTRSTSTHTSCTMRTPIL
jgi:hypothetical protein